MKIRISFVSNSSSSSFIILGEKPDNIFCKELNKVQAKLVIDYYNKDEFNVEKIEWDGKKSVFLTPYIHDSNDLYFELNGYIYTYGGHGGPYSEDYFDSIAEEYTEFYPWKVWILKDHNPKINIK